MVRACFALIGGSQKSRAPTEIWDGGEETRHLGDLATLACSARLAPLAPRLQAPRLSAGVLAHLMAAWAGGMGVLDDGAAWSDNEGRMQKLGEEAEMRPGSCDF